METGGLLLKNARPLNYEITLKPDFEEFTFWGRELVTLEVLEPTRKIVLNSAELEIISAGIVLQGIYLHRASRISLDEKSETLTLEFDEPVEAGQVKLDIEFQGELNDKLRGLYRSKYTLPDGKERYMATTQFEAADARRMFPCWDEPVFKATFELNLIVPSERVVLSNMPVLEEKEWPPNVKWVRFAKTPVMSTYLLAAVIGDLESISAQAFNGTVINVWTTPGKSEQGRFALDAAVRLLSFYNEYFGIPYPLPKLDLIMIPDFAAGAMENWGAVTFRESRILVNADSSLFTKQDVAITVAHEMAHMWFGDLVTMAWWDDLWLNEGFATWMSYKAIDRLFPEWNIWTQFVASVRQRALAADGMKNSHPIETHIQDPGRIGEQFDAISYNKGASVIRMLEDFLGEETFKDGLRRYIALHQYGNARTEDLWRALAGVSKKPIAKIMDSWTKQMGYPVVHAVVGMGACGSMLKLSQERFLYERDPDDPVSDATLWNIPVKIKFVSASEPMSLLMPRRSKLIRLAISDEEWLKVNPGHSGFYRVNYDQDGWTQLKEAVKVLALPASDRIGLIDDAYAMARAHYLAPAEVLSLLEAYKAEEDYSVWRAVLSSLDGFWTLSANKSWRKDLKVFGRELVLPQALKLGWEIKAGETGDTKMLRSLLLSHLGTFGDKATLLEAKKRLGDYLDRQQPIPPELKSTVFYLAAKTGDEVLYEKLKTRFRTLDSAEEKELILESALSSFEKRALLKDFLSFCLSQDVRSQDAAFGIIGVASNRYGRQLAWDFVREHWDELMAKYDGALMLLSYIIRGVGGAFSTFKKAQEVEKFFAARPVPSAERSIRQAVESVKTRAVWLSRHNDKMEEWLAEWTANHPQAVV